MHTQKTREHIVSFTKEQVGEKPVVLGLSGGIDSALVAYLAVEALGKEKVHGLILPSSTNTSQDMEYATLVAKKLDISHITYHISRIIEIMQEETNLFKETKTLGNLKARIRMTILYGKANELDGIVLGTGNKTELMVGYFTKYGDGGVDILPIGDLYKTQVRELAAHVGVPQEIIDRAPTAGLWEGQTDEGELGITYEELDKILIAIEQTDDLSGFGVNDVERVKDMMKNSQHKRMLAPICKIK